MPKLTWMTLFEPLGEWISLKAAEPVHRAVIQLFAESDAENKSRALANKTTVRTGSGWALRTPGIKLEPLSEKLK